MMMITTTTTYNRTRREVKANRTEPKTTSPAIITTINLVGFSTSFLPSFLPIKKTTEEKRKENLLFEYTQRNRQCCFIFETESTIQDPFVVITKG
ncbi:hypothetical protein L6452_23715 [Arctium lappa]|uniref:Uncharacterized protein n=1 Tax=Arctium lappa TaxID=4217 RepID=A0ACB9B6T3_ARCLA|nr:hypothetical protein L6452_23715 [Arctium lappa]